MKDPVPPAAVLPTRSGEAGERAGAGLIGSAATRSWPRPPPSPLPTESGEGTGVASGRAKALRQPHLCALRGIRTFRLARRPRLARLLPPSARLGARLLGDLVDVLQGFGLQAELFAGLLDVDDGLDR